MEINNAFDYIRAFQKEMKKIEKWYEEKYKFPIYTLYINLIGNIQNGLKVEIEINYLYKTEEVKVCIFETTAQLYAIYHEDILDICTKAIMANDTESELFYIMHEEEYIHKLFYISFKEQYFDEEF